MNVHVRDNLNAVARAGTATGLTPTTSAADITSTATETSMRTATAAGNTTGWLIPAGLIGTDRLLCLKMVGDMLCNAASGSFRVRCYLRDGVGGNTLLFDDTMADSADSAAWVPWFGEVCVAALGSASSQLAWMNIDSLRPGTTAPTSGLGDASFAMPDSPDAYIRLSDDAASAVDMSAATYLDVTGTWGASSASLSWRLKYATLIAL